MPGGRAERGQATLELALVLPFLAVLLMIVVQVVIVGVVEVRTVHAAREGARAAAVGEDAATAAVERGGLVGARTAVSTTRAGTRVTVRVTHHQPTSVPLVGALVGDITHTAEVTMRDEQED